MVLVFDEIREISRHAAQSFLEVAGQSIEERGRFLVALSGGETPLGLYERLALDPARSAIDWSKVQFFWGDERCVPAQDPGNNFGQARDSLLDPLGIDQRNIHRIESELDPPAAAARYAQVLMEFAEPPLRWPRLDLVLLGLGEDGHTASMFPGSPVDVEQPALPITAVYQDRPANRVTLTQLVFNSARNVFFLVTGKSKASALFNVLDGVHDPGAYPAQRIKPVDGQVSWLVDREAAGSINTKSSKG